MTSVLDAIGRTSIDRRWVLMLDEARKLGADVPASQKTKGGVERLGLTPHGLRRSYFSYRHALGHDAATIALEGGHADGSTSLRIYTESIADEAQRSAYAAELGALVAAPGLRAV